MFYLKYLRRELGQRKRQTVVIALGLALGVGLVITVTAVSSGVKTAQAAVVHALYGVGTDLTVTKNPAPPNPFHPPPGVCAGQEGVGGTSSGTPSCSGNLGYPPLGTVTTEAVAKVAKLPAVSGAAGGFTLQYGGTVSNPAGTAVDGVDVDHLSLGPLSSGTITAGKALSSSDGDSDVAVVDSDYAISKGLHVGSTVTIAGHGFTVVGIVKQSQATSPPQVYIPLARVEALYGSVNHLSDDLINTIYVSTPSAANISLVQREIKRALPSVTVSSQADLASEVTGSLKNTASLAHDLGTWLAILVLLAAFALAILLTLSAVGRRVGEFGTLKALGWRSRRIIEQVLGESLVMGAFGAVLGVGLGYGAAAVITAIAPGLSAFVPAPTPGGPGSGAVQIGGGPAPGSTVPVHLTAPVPADIIIVAVVIAIAGGILAGLFASWRIAGLRPADALSRVA
jgi:putative ABC transport system permease protein